MDPLRRIEAENPGALMEAMAMCKARRAFLFDKPDGGFVLMPLVEDGVTGVLLWLAWSTARDGIAKYHGEVEQLTRQIGGQWIRFYSRRKGLSRVAVRLGWKIVGHCNDGCACYQKELSEV